MDHVNNSSGRLTISYVVVVDSDELVSVWSALFMPATESMEYLMNDDAFVFTATAYGDRLSTANHPNARVAPTPHIASHTASVSNALHAVLPTALEEVDIVTLRVSWVELDAG